MNYKPTLRKFFSFAGSSFLAVSASLHAQETLISEDFESTAGAWSLSGAATLQTDTAFASSGTGAIRLNRANSAMELTNSLPLGSRSYNEVTISFQSKWEDGSGTRRGKVFYASNGVNFVELASWTWASNGNANNSVGTHTLTLTGGVPGAAGVATSGFNSNLTPFGYDGLLTDAAKFRILYDDSGTSASNNVFIDNVAITASPEFNGQYWDTNGDTAGAGGPTPSGIWGVDSFWSNSMAGDEATDAWTAGGIAVFSAGSDATGEYTVTVDGTQEIGGLSFKNGTSTLTGDALELTSNAPLFVASGLTATVESPFTDDGGEWLVSRTGPGTLILAGDNSAAIGGMALASGITIFESSDAINGTNRNITVGGSAIMAFGEAFGALAIQTALEERVTTTSAGNIAVDNNEDADFDFDAAGLTAAYLGAIDDATFTGLLTPQGTTYRLGGAGGKFTLTDTSGMTQASPAFQVLGEVEISGNITSVTGTLTKQNSGILTLSGANSYSANTTASGGILRLTGSNSSNTQTTINAATLQLASNSNGGLASGQITFNSNFAILQAVGDDREISNDILINASSAISGPQSLTINGALTINNNRQLNSQIDAGKELVLAGQINLSNNDTPRTLTIRADSSSADLDRGKTIITGDIVNGGAGAGNLTLTSGWRESEPFYLSGTNTYSGLTQLLNGWVYFQGMQALSPNTTVRLDHTSGNNGRIALLDDASGVINLPNPFELRANNSTANHRIFVGNNNTANGGTSTGTTTDSTFVIPSLGYIINQSGNQYSSIDLDGANGYSLRIDQVNLPNANIRNANQNWEARFNPTSATLSLGNITMAAGNALKGIPILALQGTTSGNVVTGDISQASDALTTGRPLNLTKSDSSIWTLEGENTYTGTTTISGGKLFINGDASAASGDVTVSANATLGGSGILGGDVTVANNGRLEFDLSTPAGSHDSMEIVDGKTLTFSGASELTITSPGGAFPGNYILVSADDDIGGSAPATINLPEDWEATVSIVGNELVLNVTETGEIDNIPPTLVSIANDVDDGPVLVNTTVTYTVTFDEAMDSSTITDADFGNAGDASVTIDSVSGSGAVYTVEVTPTSVGTLQLQINQDAVLTDLADNELDTSDAIEDIIVIDVEAPPAPGNPYEDWADGAPFDGDASGDGIANGLAFLLGAGEPGDNALGLLPTITEDDGDLILTFSMLNADERGDATLSVQFGNDLVGWTTVVIPDDDGETVVGFVTFDIEEGDPLNNVTITISSDAADEGKLFARLVGEEEADD